MKLVKTLPLNPLPLTSKKQLILDGFLAEYLRALNETLKFLPYAKSSTELHHLTYSNIRSTSSLPSDVVQEARKDVWAKRKNVKNGFKKCAIRLNRRWFRLFETRRGTPCLRVTYSPRESFVIPVKPDNSYKRLRELLEDGWNIKSITLINEGKIAIFIDKELPEPPDNGRYIMGVDVGSTTLAAVTVFDSQTSKVVKQLYLGRDVAHRQRRYEERRAKLQSYADKGSGKAKKLLKRLKQRQRNFVKTRSGQTVKEIVNLAKSYNASIAVEKLSIRATKDRMNKNGRKKINRIPYAQFKQFLKSNSVVLQIPLHEVDAYHTSRWCPRCGAVNRGHHARNYALYRCKKCGLVVNSDRKASLAVAVKSLLERKSQGLIQPSFVQISRRRVPVNGLLRPSEEALSSAVQHIKPQMESPSL